VLFENARTICFGYGGNGRAGNDGLSVGTSSAHLSVQPLISFSAGTPPLASIGAGAGHSCALRCDGRVMCFGWNGSGQLGRESTSDYGVAGGQIAALEPVALDPSKVTYFAASVTLSSGHVIAADICMLHTSVNLVEPASDISLASWTPSNAVWSLNLGATSASVRPHSATQMTLKVAFGLTTHAFSLALRWIPSVKHEGGYVHICALLKENTIVCWGVRRLRSS
jgi:alpha-tubulin suppressor-like RCC1 family protein